MMIACLLIGTIQASRAIVLPLLHYTIPRRPLGDIIRMMVLVQVEAMVTICALRRCTRPRATQLCTLLTPAPTSPVLPPIHILHPLATPHTLAHHRRPRLAVVRFSVLNMVVAVAVAAQVEVGIITHSREYIVTNRAQQVFVYYL
jgi:hypothetical protein